MPNNLEEWRTIPGFPCYLASNRGRVASIMVPQTTKNRRYIIHMTKGIEKGRKNKGRLPKTGMLVHRIILETFGPPKPFDGALARHLNDDTWDNRLENLAWGSKGDNARDAIKNGRWPVSEDHPHAKLSNRQVQRIRARYDASGGRKLEKIAADYGMSVSQICGIGKRKFWKHLPEYNGR